jgi:hypothetical protein
VATPRYALVRVVGLSPAQCGQAVLETSFPTAFQRLDLRDGDLEVSLPGNLAKWRAVGWVLQEEGYLTGQLTQLAGQSVPVEGVPYNTLADDRVL